MLFRSIVHLNLLAKYNGKPAIFQRRAPDDSDELWEGDPYPQIIYETELKEGMEREFTGGIHLHVFCKSGQPVKPEDFKNPILEAMDCCFFSKENVILGTKWNNTDSGVTENQTAVEESIYAFDGMLFTKLISAVFTWTIGAISASASPWTKRRSMWAA